METRGRLLSASRDVETISRFLSEGLRQRPGSQGVNGSQVQQETVPRLSKQAVQILKSIRKKKKLTSNQRRATEIGVMWQQPSWSLDVWAPDTWTKCSAAVKFRGDNARVTFFQICREKGLTWSRVNVLSWTKKAGLRHFCQLCIKK